LGVSSKNIVSLQQVPDSVKYTVIFDRMSGTSFAQLLLEVLRVGEGVTTRQDRPALKLASEILTYFLRNPESCDDLEGVTRWRLPDQKIYETMQTTEQALEWLVREGFLVKESKPWHGDIYRLNLEKRGEANSFISGIDPERDRKEK
jgi:hypothetical protein